MPRLFPVGGQLVRIRYGFFFTYGHVGFVSILAHGKKWMNISFSCLLLLAPVLRIISVGLLAWMGTSHGFNGVSRRPWASARHGCEFCTPSPPRDLGLPGNLAMGRCWEASPRREGGRRLEMGTRLQQDLTLRQPADCTPSSGQFDYFFPNNVAYPDADVCYVSSSQ